jgi:hypothetical protein
MQLPPSKINPLSQLTQLLFELHNMQLGTVQVMQELPLLLTTKLPVQEEQ